MSKTKVMEKLYKYLYLISQRKYSRDKLWNLRNKAINTSPGIRKAIYRIRYESIVCAAGAYIPLGAYFDSRPVFPHWIYGIFISQGARIGSGCTIFQQVTIGSNTLPDSVKSGYPTIGDNVYIGAGAKIIGGVKVGNNVRIGANCVVSCDVPDNATVVLERPRVITHGEKRNNTFIDVVINN